MKIDADEQAKPEPVDTTPPDPMRWAWRIGVLSVLVIGWMFILWQNRFHVTVPVVVVCLAYLAVVSTVFNLWRVGAVAVAMNEDDESDSTWGSVLGARGELEREKKGLLRAIKEAEFDREMGKLSKVDSDEMIAVYRARAIEVIKEIDKLDAGAVGTVRDQILREVKARLEIEDKTRTAVVADVAAKKKAKKGDKSPAKAAEATETAAAKAATALEKATAAVTAAKKAVEVSTDASVPAEVAAAATAEADAAVADAEAAMADATSAAAVAEAAAEAASEEQKADVKEATT